MSRKINLPPQGWIDQIQSMPIFEIRTENIDLYKRSLIDLILIHLQNLGAESSADIIEKTIETILSVNSQAHIIAQTKEDKPEVTGFCFFNTGTGLETGGRYIWLNEIHVKSDFRNKGNGQALLDYLIKWAKQNGYSAIYGITQNMNSIAQGFFKSNSFAQSEVIWLDRQINQ